MDCRERFRVHTVVGGHAGSEPVAPNDALRAAADSALPRWVSEQPSFSVSSSRGGFGQLNGTGNSALQAQAWIVASVFVFTLLWAVMPALNRSPRTTL
jgi:hypothetical protein